MPHCAVVGCKSNSAHHKFPQNPHLRKQWTIKVKRARWRPTRQSALCSEHFTPDQFLINPNIARSIGFTKAHRRLKSDAIPTIFPYTALTPDRSPNKWQHKQIIEQAMKEYSAASTNNSTIKEELSLQSKSVTEKAIKGNSAASTSTSEEKDVNNHNTESREPATVKTKFFPDLNIIYPNPDEYLFRDVGCLNIPCIARKSTQCNLKTKDATVQTCKINNVGLENIVRNGDVKDSTDEYCSDEDDIYIEYDDIGPDTVGYATSGT